MSTNQDTTRLVTFLAPVDLIEGYQAVVKEREQTMAQALRLHMKEVLADAQEQAA